MLRTLDVPETDAENQIDIDPREPREGKDVELEENGSNYNRTLAPPSLPKPTLGIEQ